MEKRGEGMGSRVTVLLEKLHEGDAAALEEIMPLVYGELRRIAQSYFRRQRPGLRSSLRLWSTKPTSSCSNVRNPNSPIVRIFLR